MVLMSPGRTFTHPLAPRPAARSCRGSWRGARELELAGEQPPSWQTIHRRIRWDAPAPTLTCSANRPGSWRCLFREAAGEDKGGTYHRLSLEEAACLMGFPPGYVITGPVNARFRQVGNAVPPPLSRALLLHLRLLLSLPPLTAPP